MMAFILATDFDFIAYMSKMAFSLDFFFTPMAFLEYLYNGWEKKRNIVKEGRKLHQ